MTDADFIVRRICVAYLDAAAFTDTDNDECPLSNDARSRALRDCAAFWSLAADIAGETSMTWEQLGHDFWLTRNRHGAGFWSRGLGRAGDQLTDIAHSFGECHLFRGDDGLAYFCP